MEEEAKYRLGKLGVTPPSVCLNKVHNVQSRIKITFVAKFVLV